MAIIWIYAQAFLLVCPNLRVMKETHSASELAEKLGVDAAVIHSGDDAAEYLDNTAGTSVAADGGSSEEP